MSEQSQEQQEPQVITLTLENSSQILLNYIEIANKAGSFLLQESDILKRCKDVLLSGAQDPEVNVVNARQLLIQGIIKGQGKGAYTLDDASILHKVCSFVNNALTQPQTSAPVSSTPVSSTPVSSTPVSTTPVSTPVDDLSELSMPVPLKGPRVL
jgi:hypothetical protein